MANADVARSYFFNGSCSNPHHHLSTESLMEEVHMSMEGLALSPSGSTSTSPSSSGPSLAASSDDFDWCRMDLPPLSPSSPAHTSTPSSSPLHYNNGGSHLISTRKTWPSPSSSSSADFFFADWASRLIGTTTMLELQLTSAMAGIDGTKCSAVAEAPQLPFKALR